ncbi:hypothetical protein RM863_35620 [Streptomyces sp. DSM 41014]|uniref:Gliding motility protein n=1 Tax=Streptomyces hintoniae TaxID=3075521 RepID=A0ABU2UVZ0_9ACTN|nr:hypothetical protein [Streptomyces sp. DSM 41014]MDT0477465.1 hypothetical protein [Streptomyces sp. DSM 41014]
MGVFARLIRRSKATEEAAAEETTTAEAPSSAAEAGVADAEAGAADAVTAVEPAPVETGDGADAEVTAAAEGGVEGAGEGIGIPKQQSVGQATDSEADEGARR